MKKMLISIALVAVLFFQLNHLAAMNLLNSHDAGSQCVTEKSSSTNGCLCCVLEQADKNQQIFSQQNFNLTPALPPKSTLIEPVAVPPRKRLIKNKSSPEWNKWLRTIVQNK